MVRLEKSKEQEIQDKIEELNHITSCAEEELMLAQILNDEVGVNFFKFCLSSYKNQLKELKSKL